MTQNQKYCAGCGAPAPPDAASCSVCGRPFWAADGQGMPVPPRAPAPAQGTPPQGFPTQQSAPAQQGAPAPRPPERPVPTVNAAPPASPPSGYGGVNPASAGPGYGGQPSAGPPAPMAGGWQQPVPAPAPAYAPPGQYPGGQMVPAPAYAAKPAKKKNRVPLIIILSVLIAAVAGVAVWLAVWAGSGRMEYQRLRDSICAAQSPAQVVQNAAPLADFEQQHPGLVDPDLRTLVDKCAEYQNAPEKDAKYINMSNYLTSLESSQVPGVANCAGVLMETVQAQDSQYLAEAKAVDEQAEQSAEQYIEEQPQESPVSGALLQPVYTDFVIETNNDGEEIFSFSCVNQSDLTIDYYEVWVFCYDAEGNMIPGDDRTGVEWSIDDTPNLAPGDTLDKDAGFWTFNNCENVSIIVPVVSYIEFEDGSTWGITNESKVFDSDMELLILLMSMDTDFIAGELAAQGYAQGPAAA